MKIINTIEIKSTPEKVFYWLEDPGRAIQWMKSVSKTEFIKQTPDKIGTTFREYIEENGRGTEMNGVWTDFVANKRLAFHLEGEFDTVDVVYTLEKKGDTTQLLQDAEVNFKGLLKVLIIFLGPVFKKKTINQAQSEFVKLKELCEKDI